MENHTLFQEHFGSRLLVEFPLRKFQNSIREVSIRDITAGLPDGSSAFIRFFETGDEWFPSTKLKLLSVLSTPDKTDNSDTHPYQQFLGRSLLVRRKNPIEYENDSPMEVVVKEIMSSPNGEHFVLFQKPPFVMVGRISSDLSSTDIVPQEWFSVDKLELLGTVSSKFHPSMQERASLGREITSHHVVNDCNRLITLRALDERDGLAPTEYAVFLPTYADYFYLRFQNGPPADGVNGLTHEVLIAILIDRFTAFQSGPFACQENADALNYLISMHNSLFIRTRDRQSRGVEGTYDV